MILQPLTTQFEEIKSALTQVEKMAEFAVEIHGLK